MQVLGVEGMAGGTVVLRDVERVQHAVEVLHVRDVAADADDGGGVKRPKALDISEAGEGAIGSWGMEVRLAASLRRGRWMQRDGTHRDYPRQ